jgi:hypothetical protein
MPIPCPLLFETTSIGHPTAADAAPTINLFDESNVNKLPVVATLLPFRYNTPLAVPPERVAVLTVKLVPEIFVMLALVPVSVVTVAEVTVTLVRDKLLIVRLPTRATVNDASAQVRLDGFVPSSITALAEVME